jgi:hypothetical protein
VCVCVCVCDGGACPLFFILAIFFHPSLPLYLHTSTSTPLHPSPLRTLAGGPALSRRPLLLLWLRRARQRPAQGQHPHAGLHRQRLHSVLAAQGKSGSFFSFLCLALPCFVLFCLALPSRCPLFRLLKVTACTSFAFSCLSSYYFCLSLPFFSFLYLFFTLLCLSLSCFALLCLTAARCSGCSR